MMPKTIRDALGTLFIGLFCSLVAFSLGAVFGGDQPQQQSNACPKYPSKEYNATSETFGEKLTTDPVAFFTLWLTVFTAVLAVSTIGLWIVTGRASAAQARDMEKSIAAARDQLTLAYPPKLRVDGIHMWVKGHGSPLNPSNKAPSLIPGATIEGAVLAINFGRETAFIERSDCIPFWHSGPLPMSNPLWGRFPKNAILEFDETGAPYALKPSTPKEMRPGVNRRWDFETVVPKDAEGKNFYVLGYVMYKDRLGTHRGVYFARKYIPNGSEGSFVAVKDTNYEAED